MAVSIPEGFGAWGNLNTFSFETTTTYSCHGIAAWNPGTAEGGIYHVGANSWEQERLAMEMLMSSLAPTTCWVSQGAWVAPGPILGGLLANPIGPDDRNNLLDESADIQRVCNMYCPGNVNVLGPRMGLRFQWTPAAGIQFASDVGANFDVNTHGDYHFHYVCAGRRVGVNSNGYQRAG